MRWKGFEAGAGHRARSHKKQAIAVIVEISNRNGWFLDQIERGEYSLYGRISSGALRPSCGLTGRLSGTRVP